MERKSRLLAVLTVTMIVTAIFTPIFLTKTVNATDPTDWYMNVPGVLDSDYYDLYPFQTDKSLKIGFSQFGEMIDSINNIGLEYRDRDAFAPPAGPTIPDQITKKKWMSGWLINITYQATAERRNVWAVAQHSDLTDYGKDWIRISRSYGYANCLTEGEEDPRDVGKLIGAGTGPFNGGRKTNGTAITDPIRILYNGPRMFIARTVTHIYDWDPAWTEDEPLVDVVFTFIFNKDKKEVIVLKDIKEITTKFVFGEMKVPINSTGGIIVNATVNGAIVQFSNRGEWDIGPVPNFESYVHFYTDYNNEGQPTVYNEHYHLNPTMYPAAWLGISTHGDEPGPVGTYDVAQIISGDETYAGWAAFWPSLSNWHVNAGYQDKWWKSLGIGEDTADKAGEPFTSPYLIGEWDFVLTKKREAVHGIEGYSSFSRTFDRQFRGVTVYGLTDNWNGDDAASPSAHNIIDREVRYQLEEVFNPWDLLQAVHKKTDRWVDFHTITIAEYDAAYGQFSTNVAFNLSHWPVIDINEWDSYCNDTERVEWGGEMKHPVRSVWSSGSSLSSSEPYELSVNANTGVGTITIRAASCPAVGTIIKVLYSTDTEYAHTTYTADLTASDFNETANHDKKFTLSDSYGTSFTDKLGVLHDIDIRDFDFGFRNVTGGVMTANKTWTYGPYTMDWEVEPFKVFKEETTHLELGDENFYKFNSTQSPGGTLELNMTKLLIEWDITGPAYTDVHMRLCHPDVTFSYTIGFWQNTTAYNYNVTVSLTLGHAGYLYNETTPGRYEWFVVGNHSQPIDSEGAGMVTAAFKNKQVEIGNAGLDMQNLWGLRTPYLMSDLGSATWRAGGPAWTDIYDSLGRLAYRDDWCTRYAVSTSNIITVAGPPANLMSEYWNEFSQALMIYGITSGNQRVRDGMIDVIFAPTCWNTTKYSGYKGQYYYSDGDFSPGNTNTGIGVISTYKDINGTIGFLIYGWSGDDTYYVCKWFHEYGIYYLQQENPGVTALIVKIDYNDYSSRSLPNKPPNYNYDSHNPYITILERLGTISEKTPHDP